MTDDGKLVVQCLFETIWRLFTSWYIPGTNVTPAGAALFLVVATIGISFVLRVFNVTSAFDVSRSVDTIKQRKAVKDSHKNKIGF